MMENDVQGSGLDRSTSPAFLEGVPHATLLFDDEMRVLDCNGAAVDFFGFDSRDACLRGFESRFSLVESLSREIDGARGTFESILRRAVDEGDVASEMELGLAGGVSRESWVTFRRVPLGDSFGIIVCAVDLASMRYSRRELIREDNLLRSINHVSSVLMTAGPDDFDLAVWHSLRTMGRTVNVDRAYIWENFTQGDSLYCRQTYEWSEGAEPQQGNDLVSALLYDEIPHWRDAVMSGRTLNGPIRDLPTPDRTILEQQGIASVLIIPVLLKGEAWGFIGFDDCWRERYFSEAEEQLLLSGGTLIVSAIVRNQATNDLQEQIVAAQKAWRANESKTNFLARTSHEIRTPMNAIIGMAELALREDISPVVRGYVADIKHASTALLAIINDILDFSKIESGKIEIVPVNYELSSLINDVVSIIRMRAAKKGLLFTVNVDSALPDELYGDAVRIRQILINVLDNAVKYTAEGFVSLEVAGVSEETSSDRRILFTVSDSGVGIRDEDFGRLFQDFVQLDMQKNTDVVGTGLGLTISRNFARAMGGDIVVLSEYGRGSTFCVNLPQAVRSDKKIAASDAYNEKSILLHESDERLIDSIQRSCAGLGVSCDIARTELEFASALERGGYTHIFVGRSLYAGALRLYRGAGSSAEFALLADIDHPREGDVRLIQLPVHTVVLANFLSDATERAAHSVLVSMFTAPDARILIVDDNETNLKVASGLMGHYRMQVDTCTSGAEALRLVDRNMYDIVFMDHMMPEMDGVQATKAVRAMGERDPRYADLPIVALTANAVFGMEEMFLAEGMSGFLPKPIEVSKLHRCLLRWIPEGKIFMAGEESFKDAPCELVVEGVDTKAGLRQTGGTADKYRDVLASYCAEGAKLGEMIRSCLAENDLSRFTVYVHSLKSSSAAIGAFSLSARAACLEAAGDRKDRNAIESTIDAFIGDLGAQIARISDAIRGYERCVGASGDPVFLSERLHALRQAVQTFDVTGADSVLLDLNGFRWPEGVAHHLKKIGEDILLSDLESAENRIEKLMYAGGRVPR